MYTNINQSNKFEFHSQWNFVEYLLPVSQAYFSSHFQPRNIRIKIYKIGNIFTCCFACVNLDLPYEERTIDQCILTCLLWRSRVTSRYSYHIYEGIVMLKTTFLMILTDLHVLVSQNAKKCFSRCCLHVQWMDVRLGNAWTVGRIVPILSIQESIRDRWTFQIQK